MARYATWRGSVLLWCCVSILPQGRHAEHLALASLCCEKKHSFMFILYVFYDRERWQRKWPGQMWPPGGPDVWETQYRGPCDGGLPHQREAEKPHLFSLKTISVNTASVHGLLLRGLRGTSHTSKLGHLMPEFWNVLSVKRRNGIQLNEIEDQHFISQIQEGDYLGIFKQEMRVWKKDALSK